MTTTSSALPESSAAPHSVRKDSLRGWTVAAGGFVCLLFSVGVLVVYSFGVLAPSMGDEFGWSNVQRSTLFVSFSICSVISGPIWGGIADRVGVKRVVVASTILLAACFGGVSLLPNSLPLAYFAFAMIGLLGGGTLPPSYASLVVGWFERYRGLALGATLVGVGLGAALLPAVAARIVSLHGWREMCQAYALMVLVFALPCALFALQAYPEPRMQRHATGQAVGATVRTALRQSRIWILALFAFLSGLILIGSVTSLIPLLQSRGEPLVAAARYQSILGLSLVAGRVIGGGLLDRFFAPRVITGILLATAIGFLILHQASSPVAYVLAAVGIGLAIGTEIDFLAFVVSRYYDKASFTTIYALLFATHALGATFGPPAVAWMHRVAGGYGPGLLLSSVLMFGLSLLLFALPRYETHK